MKKKWIATLMAAAPLCVCAPVSFARTSAMEAPIPAAASSYPSRAEFDAARRKAIESVGNGALVPDSFIKRWFGDLPSSAYATPMHVVAAPAGPTEVLFGRDSKGYWRKIEAVAVPGAASGEGMRKAKAMSADGLDAKAGAGNKESSR